MLTIGRHNDLNRPTLQNFFEYANEVENMFPKVINGINDMGASLAAQIKVYFNVAVHLQPKCSQVHALSY